MELKDVIKLVRELKKSGALSKKKRKRINKKLRADARNKKYTNPNYQQSNPGLQSYGYNNVNQNSSNLNTLIASEQLAVLEKKEREKRTTCD